MSEKEVTSYLEGIGIRDKAEVALFVKAYNTNNYELVGELITKKKWKEFRQNVKKRLKIYCRYPPTVRMAKSNETESIIQGIVMGPCGNGKTCLINHVCGSDLPFGSSNSSLTRDVTQMPCQFLFAPQFILYDTPGTTAINDKLQHAVLLRQILTYKPINAVFILVKYNNRFNQLIRTISHQVSLLKGYQSSIVFMVSHIDLEKDPETVIKSINEMLTELQIPNNMIYFSNNSCDERELSQAMYRIAASMPKRKIQIDQEHFLLNFNLVPDKGEEVYFSKDLKKTLESMEEITNIYINCALKLPKNEQRQAILQDLQISLKLELLDVLEKFKKKFNATMVLCEFYTTFYHLQTKVLDFMNLFHRRAKNYGTYKYIQNSATGDKTDIRDLIKKCPNPECGLIWFRIQACPNTTCGNRPSCFFDFIKNAFFSFFSIKRVGERIIIEKSQKKNNFQSNKIAQERVKSQVSKKTNYLGCNQNMNFETLPRLQNIEQKLMEWYGVHSIQEVINRFQAEKDLEAERVRLERMANQSFKGFLYK